MHITSMGEIGATPRGRDTGSRESETYSVGKCGAYGCNGYGLRCGLEGGAVGRLAHVRACVRVWACVRVCGVCVLAVDQNV